MRIGVGIAAGLLLAVGACVGKAQAQNVEWTDQTFIAIEVGENTWSINLVMGHHTGRDVLLPVGTAAGTRIDRLSVAPNTQYTVEEHVAFSSTFFELDTHLILHPDVAAAVGLTDVPDFEVMGNEWVFQGPTGSAVSSVISTHHDPMGVLALVQQHYESTVVAEDLPVIDPESELDLYLNSGGTTSDGTQPRPSIWRRSVRALPLAPLIPIVLDWLTPNNPPPPPPAPAPPPPPPPPTHPTPAWVTNCKAQVDAMTNFYLSQVAGSQCTSEQRIANVQCVNFERTNQHLGCEGGQAPSTTPFLACVQCDHE